MSFNAEKAYQQLIDWIKEYFAGQGEDTIAVLGMSGGKDSLIAAALCVKALGPKRVVGVMMPNGEQKDINDAIAAIIKSAMRMSANWDKNSIISGVGFFSSIRFRPYSAVRMKDLGRSSQGTT